jgi:shikimate dehydrogenase
LLANTDNYCVMGNPIAHSKSPQIHKAFARQTSQNLHYQAVLVAAGCFGEALTQFQREGGKGLNITVPFKGDAWASVNHRTERAEKAGAVNTIWFDEHGAIYGDTTDGIGLVNDLAANDIPLKGQRVLILGAGGAVRGVLGALLDQNVKSIVLANRTLSRAQELARNYSTDGNIQACAYNDLQAGTADIIINGTSASLENELPPLANSVVAGTCCYDMVYADTDTAFVTWAKDNGANKAIDGLGMLVQQAAESFYIWRGVRPDTMSVIETLRNKL